MFLKIYRYRFICVLLLLSVVMIIFVGNLYFKSINEITYLGRSKDESYRNSHTQSYQNELTNDDTNDLLSNKNDTTDNDSNYIVANNDCTAIYVTNATVNTVEKFSSFEFDAKWMHNRNGIWQDEFEERYKQQLNDSNRHPLKVIIMPHSHNDPGWLETFEGYYKSQTSKILNVMVEQLTEHKDMRFVWSEMSFLELWWSKASDNQREKLKNLIKSGRLEIVTGGWVMTDEANVHLYAMLDQLIEGHQWVKSTFGVVPKVGWSADPFGQGSTVPHLLAESGFKGAIIQRIHYNWKEWLARHQSGDFFWKTFWKSETSKDYTLLTHNMPFDIYSTIHSCGPQIEDCKTFNYVHPGQSETRDLKTRADLILQQYGKTASLFSHNVALVLIGGDFVFQDKDFFDRHYNNYKPLLDFINKNSKSLYNGATVQFGTPTDYFDEIKKRSGENFPSLIGDFFPYSDIFSTGVPAYWTGYFSTRPFHKFMSRDLEHNLRNAEILFTIAMNKMRQSRSSGGNFMEQSSTKYEIITEARRNLALFQHHDAVTGTSKRAVMENYLERLHKSVKQVISIQQESLEFLLQADVTNVKSQFLQHEMERKNALTFPTQKVLEITKEQNEKIVILNSLTQHRIEVASIYVSDSSVEITDSHGAQVPYQINPFFDQDDDYKPSNKKYQLIFVAEMSPMSVNTYEIKHKKDAMKEAAISSETLNQSVQDDLNSGPVIENSKMRLNFNTKGFLDQVYFYEIDKTINLDINFASYDSYVGKSGAYLFQPKSSTPDDLVAKTRVKIYIIKGPIASDVTVVYDKILVHTVRIFNTTTYLDDAISITNDINLQTLTEYENMEMIMKLKTSINNAVEGNEETEFFTDLNGFQWMPRRKTSKLGIEANYYPVTTGAFIQDKTARLTLMTTHAQGVTSWQNGELEVMLDRRTIYDDNRGMGEGVTDSVKMQHKFMLAIEFFNKIGSTEGMYQVPSLMSHHLINSLNYPINTFFVGSHFSSQLNKSIELFTHKFSCDSHLVNLRSMIDTGNSEYSSLLVLHRLGYDCQLTNADFLKQICIDGDVNRGIQLIRDVKIKEISRASLTGLRLDTQVTSFNENIMTSMDIKSFLIKYS